MNIAVVANTSWYLYNFRKNLMQALTDAGHRVVAVASADDFTARFEQEGLRARSIVLDAASTNPVRELRSVLSLARVLRQESIDLVLSYTPKGNLYSGLACALTSARQIPNISGLGRVFVEDNLLTRAVGLMYRFAFRRAERVFFQNENDREFFVKHGLVEAERSDRLPGSGVDLLRFNNSERRRPLDAPVVFVMVARLLWSKGVGEFVDAARLVLREHPQARFLLVGPVDHSGDAAVPQATIDAWVAEGVIQHLGFTEDIREPLSRADCVVLPSYYREGVPRSLLEASAMSLPVITTDLPGCRDAVDDLRSGYLCKPRDVNDLAAKMVALLTLPAAERCAMGARGRKKMELEFNEQLVIDRYLSAIAMPH